jgi:probable addiction module antidote protein
MKTEQYAPLDISSLLDSEEMIVEYLTAAAEDEDPNVLLGALAHAAKARGMAQVAKAAGLGRESLYKALARGSHPRFETIAAVLRALGVKVEFAHGPAPAKAVAEPSTIAAFRVKPAKPTRPKAKAKRTALSKEERKLLAKRKLLAEQKQAAKRPAAKRRA